jgi:hypothetical protein
VGSFPVDAVVLSGTESNGGEATDEPDATGNASFHLRKKLDGDQREHRDKTEEMYFTATATDCPAGGTSEFSAAIPLTEVEATPANDR